MHVCFFLSTLDARFSGFEHIKELYKDDSDFVNVYNWCGPAQKHQQGPITCSKWSNDSVSKTKTLKETLNALVLNVSTKSELKGLLEYQEETLVHLIIVQEGSNTTLFGPWGEDNKGNKRILLQLGNSMGGYLFLLFLGLRGCMEGYK
jgi:hypothetical protein